MFHYFSLFANGCKCFEMEKGLSLAFSWINYFVCLPQNKAKMNAIRCTKRVLSGLVSSENPSH